MLRHRVCGIQAHEIDAVAIAGVKRRGNVEYVGTLSFCAREINRIGKVNIIRVGGIYVRAAKKNQQVNAGTKQNDSKDPSSASARNRAASCAGVLITITLPTPSAGRDAQNCGVLKAAPESRGQRARR